MRNKVYLTFQGDTCIISTEGRQFVITYEQAESLYRKLKEAFDPDPPTPAPAEAEPE